MAKNAQKKAGSETPVLPAESPSGAPSLAAALTPKLLLDSTPAEWIVRSTCRRAPRLISADSASRELGDPLRSARTREANGNVVVHA